MCKHEEKILHKLWNAKKDELNLTKHKDKKLHHKPDFIDRLIAYESGELPQKESTKFLKEVKKKGLANKLQGHYGREIARRKL